MCTCTVCYTPSSELSSQAIDTMSHPDVVNMIIQFITLPVLPYNVKSISGVCVCVCVVLCMYNVHIVIIHLVNTCTQCSAHTVWHWSGITTTQYELTTTQMS